VKLEGQKRYRGEVLFITHRGNEQFYFCPDLEPLPFERPVSKLKFEMTSIEDKEAKANYRFNCLVKDEMVGPTGMVSFKENFDRIPEYNIAIQQTVLTIEDEHKQQEGSSKWLYVYYPITSLYLKFYREPEYLIFSILLPILLLDLSLLAIFVLGPTDFSDKLSTVVTLLLAMFAFTFTVRQSIPSVPYLTALEKHIIVSIGILFFTLLEAVVTVLLGECFESTMVKYVLFGMVSFVCFVSTVVVSVQWFSFRSLNNRYDEANEKYFHDEKVKIQSAGDFDWSLYKHRTRESEIIYNLEK